MFAPLDRDQAVLITLFADTGSTLINSSWNADNFQTYLLAYGIPSLALALVVLFLLDRMDFRLQHVRCMLASAWGGSGEENNKDTDSSWIRFENTIFYIQILFAVLFCLPFAFFFLWGLAVYSGVNKLAGICLALVLTALGMLLIGMEGWKRNAFIMTPLQYTTFSVTVLALGSCLFVVAFMSEPYSFIGVSTVFICSNMGIMMHVVYAEFDHVFNVKPFESYSFTSALIVAAQKAYALGGYISKETYQKKVEVAAKTASASKAAGGESVALIPASSPSTSLSSPISPPSSSSSSLPASASASASSASSPAVSGDFAGNAVQNVSAEVNGDERTPSRGKIPILLVAAIFSLAGYVCCCYYLSTTPTQLQWTALILVASVLIADVLTLVAVLAGKIKSALDTCLFMIVGRFGLIIIGEKYWYLGHTFVFSAFLLYCTAAVIARVFPQEEDTELQTGMGRTEVQAGEAGKIDPSEEDAEGLNDFNESCCTALDDQKKQWCMQNLDFVAFVTILLVFGGDTYLASQVETQTIYIGSDIASATATAWAQYQIGFCVAFVILAQGLLLLFRNLFIRRKGKCTWGVLLCAIAVVGIIIGFGVVIWQSQNALSALIFSVFLPLTIIITMVTYRQWVDMDYSIIDPALQDLDDAEAKKQSAAVAPSPLKAKEVDSMQFSPKPEEDDSVRNNKNCDNAPLEKQMAASMVPRNFYEEPGFIDMLDSVKDCGTALFQCSKRVAVSCGAFCKRSTSSLNKKVADGGGEKFVDAGKLGDVEKQMGDPAAAASQTPLPERIDSKDSNVADDECEICSSCCDCVAACILWFVPTLRGFHKYRLVIGTFAVVALLVGQALALFYMVPVMKNMSYMLSAALLTVGFTYVAYASFYNRLEFTAELYVSVVIILASVGTCSGIFLSSASTFSDAFPFILILFGYPITILSSGCYFVYKDDNYFIAPEKETKFVVAGVLIVALFGASFVAVGYYYSLLAGIAAAVTFVVIAILLLLTYRTTPPSCCGRDYSVGCWHTFGKIVKVGVAVGLAVTIVAFFFIDGYAFVGISILWGGAVGVLIVFMMNKYSTNEDVAYADTVLPIFQLTTSGQEPLKSENRRALYILDVFLLVYVYGILTLFFLDNLAIGLIICALDIVLCMLIWIELENRFNLEFSFYVQMVGEDTTTYQKLSMDAVVLACASSEKRDRKEGQSRMVDTTDDAFLADFKRLGSSLLEFRNIEEGKAAEKEQEVKKVTNDSTVEIASRANANGMEGGDEFLTEADLFFIGYEDAANNSLSGTNGNVRLSLEELSILHEDLYASLPWPSLCCGYGPDAQTHLLGWHAPAKLIFFRGTQMKKRQGSMAWSKAKMSRLDVLLLLKKVHNELREVEIFNRRIRSHVKLLLLKSLRSLRAEEENELLRMLQVQHGRKVQLATFIERVRTYDIALKEAETAGNEALKRFRLKVRREHSEPTPRMRELVAAATAEEKQEAVKYARGVEAGSISVPHIKELHLQLMSKIARKRLMRQLQEYRDKEKNENEELKRKMEMEEQERKSKEKEIRRLEMEDREREEQQRRAEMKEEERQKEAEEARARKTLAEEEARREREAEEERMRHKEEVEAEEAEKRRMRQETEERERRHRDEEMLLAKRLEDAQRDAVVRARLLEEAERRQREHDEEERKNRERMAEMEKMRKERELKREKEEALRRKAEEEEEKRRQERIDEEAKQRNDSNALLDEEAEVLQAIEKGKSEVRAIVERIPNGKKWTDPEFPPNQKSLSAKGKWSDKEWKRPESWDGCEGKSIEVYVDGCDFNDINQGEIGDCYFLAAMSSLARNPGKLERIFVDKDHGGKGVYACRFFKQGKAKVVIIDDCFPTSYDYPAFVSNRNHPNEIWAPILEKAYAKLHKNFENLEGGFPHDAMVDLTGGVGRSYSLKDNKKGVQNGKLFQEMLTLHRAGHMLGAATYPGNDHDTNDTGIHFGHAYSILRVEEVDGNQLMLLRNPWGQSEWNGKWSDKDKKNWTNRMRTKLDLVEADDGAFWMAFSDVAIHFSELFATLLLEADQGWKKVKIQGEWTKKTAGGCGNYPTFGINPHFALDVPAEGTELVLFLEQEDDRGSKNKKEPYAIGIKCYQGKRDSRGAGAFGSHVVFGSESYGYMRSCVAQTDKVVGKCVVVVSTFEPNQLGSFSISMYSKTVNSATAHPTLTPL